MTRLAIFAAILLASAALQAAADEPTREDLEQETALETGPQEEQESAAAEARPERQTVRGTVSALDTQDNTISLRPSEGRPIDVRVTPMQLAGLEVGRSMTAHLVRYGERWWLAEAPAGQPEGETTAQSAVGEVTQVSVDDGRLVIDDDGTRRELQAHPEDVAELKVGQLVSVTYESLRSGDWLREVRGEAEAAEPGDLQGQATTIETEQAEEGGGEPAAQAPRASAERRPSPKVTDWREKPTGRSVFSR